MNKLRPRVRKCSARKKQSWESKLALLVSERQNVTGTENTAFGITWNWVPVPSLPLTNAMILGELIRVSKPQRLQKWMGKIIPSTKSPAHRIHSVRGSFDNYYQVQCSAHYNTRALGFVPVGKAICGKKVEKKRWGHTNPERLLYAKHFSILNLKHRGATYKAAEQLPSTRMPSFSWEHMAVKGNPLHSSSISFVSLFFGYLTFLFKSLR